MDWSEFSQLNTRKLNLGGACDCHPHPLYQDFVSVDLEAQSDYGISHDLSKPLPIESESVDQILSEHFFEHIPFKTALNLLSECHRVLKPGHHMRIAVPDYGSPRNIKYAIEGHDPKHTDHVEFPDINWARNLCKQAPFSTYQISNYWDSSEFVRSEIDFKKGWVKRTIENDHRNKRIGLYSKITGMLRDFGTLSLVGFNWAHPLMKTVRGRPLRMTSIIIDLSK